jgi:hypothetical protein
MHSLFRSLFSCLHARTSVNEGKCYCPDCGDGLIYRWVVLRCIECNTRRDSRYRLRDVIPSQRCCAFCGAQSVLREYLENPSYFQLHQARLVIFLEERQPFSLVNCLSYLLGETLGAYIMNSIHNTTAWIENQIIHPPSPRPALALLPLHTQNNTI